MPFSPPEGNLFSIFVERFEALEIPYMVSGSVAAMIYGEPRLTNDVDLVVEMDRRAALKLPSLFPPDEFYCPPADVIAVEIAREQRGHFNIIHIESGFKADVYLRGNDPLHIWALKRIRRVAMGARSVAIAPLEYVIVRKLEYFREGGSEKHLRDIRGILKNATGLIDRAELDRLVGERGLMREWELAKTVPM